jgi:hypothetical protein
MRALVCHSQVFDETRVRFKVHLYDAEWPWALRDALLLEFDHILLS